MFSRLLQASARAAVQRLAAAAGLVRVSPNVLTIVGLLITVGGSVLIGLDQLLWAGVVLLFAGTFDMLDGAVARVSGRNSEFGAFLDSTTDRYAEGAVFIGLLYLFLVRLHQEVPVFLIAAALLGSLMVSYVRARAQSLGFSCDNGWFARPERVVLIVLGLLFNQMVVVLWILAIATNFTALQRIGGVWKQGRSRRSSEQSLKEGEQAQAPLPRSPHASSPGPL